MISYFYVNYNTLVFITISFYCNIAKFNEQKRQYSKYYLFLLGLFLVFFSQYVPSSQKIPHGCRNYPTNGLLHPVVPFGKVICNSQKDKEDDCKESRSFNVFAHDEPPFYCSEACTSENLPFKGATIMLLHYYTMFYIK